MPSPLDAIFDSARQKCPRLVLPEGEDDRIVRGAVDAVNQGYAKLTLLGDGQNISQKLRDAGGKSSDFEIVSPNSSSMFDDYCNAYFELRKNKGVSEAVAARIMSSPLGYGAMMVRAGDAEGSIAGAVHSTADTVRSALQIIGKAANARLVSSFFLMVLPDSRSVVFADCGLTIDPDAEALSNIAISSADSLNALLGTTPKIAMLSFSTMGSARHSHVDKVVTATKLARTQRPDLAISGELQFDAAFVPAVAASKAPGESVQGDANVFVFPDLNSGNIGYKIAQRIGGATAIGPILQGLAKPANDLSRGCSAEDVSLMIAVTAAQADH